MDVPNPITTNEDQSVIVTKDFLNVYSRVPEVPESAISISFEPSQVPTGGRFERFDGTSWMPVADFKFTAEDLSKGFVRWTPPKDYYGTFPLSMTASYLVPSTLAERRTDFATTIITVSVNDAPVIKTVYGSLRLPLWTPFQIPTDFISVEDVDQKDLEQSIRVYVESTELQLDLQLVTLDTPPAILSVTNGSAELKYSDILQGRAILLPMSLCLGCKVKVRVCDDYFLCDTAIVVIDVLGDASSLASTSTVAIAASIGGAAGLLVIILGMLIACMVKSQ